MSSLDLELDANSLETEWRRAYEACTDARADYERVQDCGLANGGLVDVARIRMERAESLKLGLMSKMDRREDRVADSPER